MMMPKPTRLTKIVRKMMRSGRVTSSAYCTCSLGSSAFAVANWRMVECGDTTGSLVDELGDPRQLVELDPGHFVRVPVVVGMQPRREEDHRDALGRVAVVIAAEIELL